MASKGEVFRIGGDEFVCITYEPLENIQSNLDRMIEEQNLTYPLELAYGMANFDPELDEDIHDVIKRSDKLMYEMKQKMEDGKDEYKRKFHGEELKQ